MRKGLFWLGDRQWTCIKPHLPTNQTGPERDDDRRIISGIIHMLQCGARWRDCPPEYGPYTTIYNRFNRWSKRGHWQAIFKALANGSRRKLLDILCERNGQNLGELCEHLNTSRQAVMQHLAILEDANLITVVWDGRQADRNAAPHSSQRERVKEDNSSRSAKEPKPLRALEPTPPKWQSSHNAA